MFEFTPRPAAAHHAQEPSADTDVLDSPAWSALTGAHARFAVGDEYAKKYADDVSPFVGVVSWDEPRVWGSLIDLFGYNAEVALSHFTGELPSGWTEISRGDGVQLIASDRVTGEPYAEAVELDADDVEEMLAIVSRNRPGPFLPRTYELGRYVGVRREGRLVAMAGERLHPDGFTEISAVLGRRRLPPPGARLGADARYRARDPSARRRAVPARIGREHERDRDLREARLPTASQGDLPPRADAGGRGLGTSDDG